MEPPRVVPSDKQKSSMHAVQMGMRWRTKIKEGMSLKEAMGEDLLQVSHSSVDEKMFFIQSMCRAMELAQGAGPKIPVPPAKGGGMPAPPRNERLLVPKNDAEKSSVASPKPKAALFCRLPRNSERATEIISRRIDVASARNTAGMDMSAKGSSQDVPKRINCMTEDRWPAPIVKCKRRREYDTICDPAIVVAAKPPLQGVWDQAKSNDWSNWKRKRGGYKEVTKEEVQSADRRQLSIIRIWKDMDRRLRSGEVFDESFRWFNEPKYLEWLKEHKAELRAERKKWKLDAKETARLAEQKAPEGEHVRAAYAKDEQAKAVRAEDEHVRAVHAEDERTGAAHAEDEHVRAAYAKDEQVKAAYAEDEHVRAVHAEGERTGAVRAEDEHVRAAYAKDEQVKAAYAEDEHVRAVHAEDERTQAVHAEDEHVRAACAKDEQVKAAYAEDEHVRAVHPEDERVRAVRAEDEYVRAAYAKDEQVQAVRAEDEHVRAVHAEDEHVRAVHAEDEYVRAVHAEDERTEAVHAEDERTEAVHVEDERTEAVHVEDERTEAVHVEGRDDKEAGTSAHDAASLPGTPKRRSPRIDLTVPHAPCSQSESAYPGPPSPEYKASSHGIGQCTPDLRRPRAFFYNTPRKSPRRQPRSPLARTLGHSSPDKTRRRRNATCAEEDGPAKRRCMEKETRSEDENATTCATSQFFSNAGSSPSVRPLDVCAGTDLSMEPTTIVEPIFGEGASVAVSEHDEWCVGRPRRRDERQRFIGHLQQHREQDRSAPTLREWTTNANTSTARRPPQQEQHKQSRVPHRRGDNRHVRVAHRQDGNRHARVQRGGLETRLPGVCVAKNGCHASYNRRDALQASFPSRHGVPQQVRSKDVSQLTRADRQPPTNDRLLHGVCQPWLARAPSWSKRNNQTRTHLFASKPGT